MSSVWPVIAALIPSVGVGVLFLVAIRSILRADRNERTALARLGTENSVPNEKLLRPGDAIP